MQAFKICPQCQQQAPVNAPVCTACGRAYRTQFAPLDQTQVILAQPAAHAPSQPIGFPRTRSRYGRVAGTSAGIVAFFAIVAFGIHRYVNPYPFVGDWFYASSATNQPGAMYRFKRDGTGIIYTAANVNENTPDHLPSQTMAADIVASPLYWKADGGNLMITTEAEDRASSTIRVAWSVSDDGTILTFAGGAMFATDFGTQRFIRRSSLPIEPGWLSKVH